MSFPLPLSLSRLSFFPTYSPLSLSLFRSHSLTDTGVVRQELAVSSAAAVDSAICCEETQVLATTIVVVAWGEFTFKER